MIQIRSVCNSSRPGCLLLKKIRPQWRGTMGHTFRLRTTLKKMSDVTHTWPLHQLGQASLRIFAGHSKRSFVSLVFGASLRSDHFFEVALKRPLLEVFVCQLLRFCHHDTP